MNLLRSYNRKNSDLRPVELKINFYDYAEGSCYIKYGRTEVLCVATVEDNAPPHLRGKGTGWVTAEYNMLPRSSKERIRREKNGTGGRTHEIQRLIGRALRSVTKLDGWGERSIILDCDVIQADGGTRTASITGAFVALVQAFRYLKSQGKISADCSFPIKDYLAAVSVGLVQGQPVLDLDYSEDSTAQADMNVVMTSRNEIVEIQGTAEEKPFSKAQFQELLVLGEKGCQELFAKQQAAIGQLDW